jgi:hypothetical protein
VRHFPAWCLERKIELAQIEPGKPAQNAHLESFHEKCGRENRFFGSIEYRRLQSKDLVAERVGFEPTVEFPQHTLSKRAP